jgi:phosphoesterase RecJ-like protein
MTEEWSITALLGAFRWHPHFVVTSHARPDGDAIGSVLALGEILNQLGCTTDLILADPIPLIYRTLPNVDRIRVSASASDAMYRRAGTDPAPAILLECDGIERTGLRDLEGRALINIDHHASSRNFGTLNWIDPNACAVAAMIYRLAIAAKVEITASMATCLYTAILSDTGSFNHPNTNSESFAIAHELTLRGANPSQIARDLYFSNPVGKVRLLATALGSLERRGRVAYSWITLEDLARAEAGAEDCEGIVNYLIGIDGVDAAFFLREQPDSHFRLSMRSRGGVNVAHVAEIFNGGGHKSASGCTIAGPLGTAIERILKQLDPAKAAPAGVQLQARV